MTTRTPTPLKFFVLSINFAISLVLLLHLGSCSGDSQAARGRGREQLIPAVEAVQARFGSLPLTERLSGSVKAKNQVELYPQVSAAIEEIYVNNGEFVESGQALLKLRDTEFREQLKQAEANYRITVAQAKQADAAHKRLQAELERSTNLSDKNLISPSEFEEIESQAIAAEADAELAQARVEQAWATVEERKEELSRTVVRAPVEGTIGNRNAEIGMLVTSNTRLFTLGQLDSVRVEVILTDHMLSYIDENQRSTIASENLPGGVLSAPVARISPFLHPVSHSTIAEIEFANPGHSLMPGMFVTVDIYYGESEEATQIPLSAIWENPATASVGVFITTDSLTGEPIAQLDESRGGGTLTDPKLFRFVPINVIARGAMSAGVSGIEPGAWVVTIGQDLLGDDSGSARVRPVTWNWVEELQRLQREDLIQDIIQRKRQQEADTAQISSSHDITGKSS